MAKRTISQSMPANLSWCSWWTRTRRNPIASTLVAGGVRAPRVRLRRLASAKKRRFSEEEALRTLGPDAVYYATRLRGASN